VTLLVRVSTVVVLASLIAAAASAQSTAASLSGTVRDQQAAVIPGASISLRNIDTGQTNRTMTDRTGDFHAIGIAPGRYEIRVELSGFTPFVEPDVGLSIGQEAALDVTLTVAAVTETTTVVAAPAVGELSKTALGWTFSTKDIDELPVAARDFNNLALLTPGILVDHSTGRNPRTLIATAGQIGRNNTSLIDGLTVDEHLGGVTRGGVPLDAVKEFLVLTNTFSSEYGQASGAIVSVLTRAGTNRASGRAYYFHRADRWDATDGSARLASPPREKTRLEGRVLGGFFGGPLVRDRAFHFWSAEYTSRNTDSVVTSNLLTTFRPGVSPVLPERFREPQLLGRADFNLTNTNALMLRYRFDRTTETNRSADGSPGLVAPERRHDVTRRDHDFGVNDNHVFGATRLNEFRFQLASRRAAEDVTPYCPRCAAENRPGIFLGKAPIVPSARTENRWQFVDTFTWLVPDAVGDHTFKAGIEGSVITGTSFAPGGFDGIWRFTGVGGSFPFDPTQSQTYPTQYTRFVGEPTSALESRLYSSFLQDQWRLTSNVTVNAGVRWDYEDAVGASSDADNVAPRVGVSIDPWRSGRTAFRGGYGIYYDAVLYRALNNAATGSQITQIIISNPGYPDPYGPNPNRSGAIVTVPPSVNRLGAEIRTPHTEQVSAGLSHTYQSMTATADVVWARGHNLLRTRDINYPDLTNPARPRPDPAFQRIRVREMEGHSWYRALLLGVRKRHARGYSYGVAYTLSRSERDTEDWEFFAADQRDYDAERGPSSSDVRHRLSATIDVDLPFGIRWSTVLVVQSALPYNITTGTDDNRDGEPTTDRPAGVGRNSAREADLWQLDARLAKVLASSGVQVELLAEAFNLTNRRNWTQFDGVLSSVTFGKATDAGPPRQIQVGIRMGF